MQSPLRLNAYVLAADPTWLEYSVGAYYAVVDRIVVSYDRRFRGWTGSKIPVDECLARLRAIDVSRKMEFVSGDFSAAVADPMENDTLQRNDALRRASQGADWVLQLDTDEWIPNVRALLRVLHQFTESDCVGVEWPMRVLYRGMGGHKALEVCSSEGGDHFEYIAPVIVRANTPLVHSRRVEGTFVRPVVRGDRASLQIRRDPSPLEIRSECLQPEEVIVHNSWARPPRLLQRKLASWSHSCTRIWWYYFTQWLPSRWRWSGMRNFHPFFGEVWPALRLAELPFPVWDPVQPHGVPQIRSSI
jgi:hypothetical protein